MLRRWSASPPSARAKPAPRPASAGSAAASARPRRAASVRARWAASSAPNWVPFEPTNRLEAPRSRWASCTKALMRVASPVRSATRAISVRCAARSPTVIAVTAPKARQGASATATMRPRKDARKPRS